MPYAKNGNITIYYESAGPKDGAPLILVAGYTSQLVSWDKDLTRLLNQQGIRTIVFDNRDVGLSSQTGSPDQTGKLYDVTDMAKDVLAIADAEGLERFNIMGVSMGGMITQQILAEYSQRISSAIIGFTAPSQHLEWLTSKESAADEGGNVGLDVASSREEAVNLFVTRERACHTTSAYPFNEEKVREQGILTYDRCYRPDGWRRQQAAIADFMADEDKLATLDLPVAVLHGRRDPFFSPKAGIHIASLLKNSELHIYPGMAHELPEALWDDFVRIITRTIERGQKTEK